MSLTYFGTDGIRGPWGGDSLNEKVAFRAGRAAVSVARDFVGDEVPEIVVGRDTRASGEALLAAFAKGVSAEGGITIDLGIAPTPCVAYAAKRSQASLACSLTASHNPASDNGIKFFEGTGVKPSEALEQALDDAIGAAGDQGLGDDVASSVQDGSDLKQLYIEGLAAHFPQAMLAGKRVALDCAHGAMSEIAPKLFETLGASVDVVANRPDGSNINKGVGSEHPGSLKSLYEKNEYDLGFAFDGDGDRVILSDENGDRVSGEALLAALAIDAKEKGALHDNVLVTTVQSNLGLDAALSERGITALRTDVGDKHIARLMLSKGYSLGGEESGHVVIGRFAVTGDGLCAALALSALIAQSAQPISSWAGLYQAFPQLTRAIRIASKPPLDRCAHLSDCIRKWERELAGDGRLLVRYSGTEAKIRLLVEARSEEAVGAAMADLERAVERDLQRV
ncbi:hypothetical protein [Pelagicoccus sp. SDUM812003]|uniref:hypothetical protein n=1 Tax=Pelagicoccus sp. SDUM812003 TaxID=3041267 RepID=UPI00280C55EC|nr:hypothetical protein [Pelagicoccus sp. SDUM812003]MDQ8201972.1 hypothetical protein [Pelagicoccus sp. SDUM812003]